MAAPVLLTIEELAARLQVPVSSAYIYAAEIGRIRIGKHLRVSEQDLAQWLQRQREKPSDFASLKSSKRPSPIAAQHRPSSKSADTPIHLTQPRTKPRPA